MFYVLMILGVFIRLLLVPFPGFKADIAFWKGWGLAVVDKGIIWLVKNTNYNYPPGFAYILFLINKIYAIFTNPYNINQYWADNNFFYLLLVKSLPIISDILIVFLLIKICQKSGSRWGIVLGLIYFLNPATIYDGVVWGQVDQFGLMLFLLSIYFLLSDRLKLASVIFVISFMMKFQNIIFIPLFYLFIYKKYSIKEVIISLQLGFLTFLLIAFPFWFKKEMGSLIQLLTINSDYFPFISLNAFNIWWIISGAQGMQVSDKNLLLGIINAKQIGLLLFIFAYFIACANVFYSRKNELIKKYFISVSLVVFAFFHLLTQSHERYLFPLLGTLLISMVYLKNKQKKSYLIFYLVFSLLFFLNMYLSMFFNYPDQVIWSFSQGETRSISLLISIFQIGLFLFFFLCQVLPEISDQLKKIVAFGLILLTAFFLKNMNYFLDQPISLTAIQPINFRQDFLYPIYNKNLNTYSNPFAFGRLSSNYFFYNNGIASHANSAIVYGLGKKFSQLKTDYGVDTEGAASASVYFLIEGDGRLLFKSEKKGRFDNPSSVNVDISGVDKLTLKIEKATDSIYGAHADWLGPVLIK